MRAKCFYVRTAKTSCSRSHPPPSPGFSPASSAISFFCFGSHYDTRTQAVFAVFREIRRPQLPLVRDLVSGVLDPALLAMPELIGAAPAVTAAQKDKFDGAQAYSPQVS